MRPQLSPVCGLALAMPAAVSAVMLYQRAELRGLFDIQACVKGIKWAGNITDKALGFAQHRAQLMQLLGSRQRMDFLATG